MPSRYAPLPNPRSDPEAENEMEAAFDDSDDEGESHPLTASSNPTGPLPHIAIHPPRSPTGAGTRAAPLPGIYDFENVDYDYPPPGSPPPPTSSALPNQHGNSNGVVPPTVDVDTYRNGPRRGLRSVLGRSAAAILPAHHVQRFGLDRELVPSGPVGGGLANDGVFANVTAKPTRPVRTRDENGQDVYEMPEEAQKDAPPSYAAAQLDAVPPYWETTVHLPSQANIPGEVMIEGLPSGSLFSFLWNMLVSVSFQFVGFLLTYLLHTTHAARLGSRAGLGVTLIQYGFALRAKQESWGGGSEGESVWNWDGTQGSPAVPTFNTAKDAEEWYSTHNATQPDALADDVIVVGSDATTSWLAFALMTVGWFILLTSVLGFWRVKRWERGILAQPSAGAAPAQPSNSVFAAVGRTFESFGLSASPHAGSLLRQGLGLSRGAAQPEGDFEDLYWSQGRRRSDDTGMSMGGTPPADQTPGQTQFIIPVDESNPEQARRMVEAYAAEERLHRDLRAAGLL